MQRVRLATQFCQSSPSLISIICNQSTRPRSRVSVWWNEMGLTNNLSFFRDRVAECYFWSLGVWFEPHYSTERLFIAKLLNLMTVLDDIYDAYGTVEELQLFTNVFERWDFQDVDGLPEYMRIFLNVFAGFMIEIEEELRKKGTLHHKHT
ncbi:(-)-germacrene D synthase-like [Iris pallida]|uniref:(-)-germacrene D synthase-like n=1 Tax=Iris pallida TaxID=29817 RepID=A0AAX6DYU7_IRIPA|nr:(-)-germacrene D synthase-like [Iris pallida]